MNYFDKETKTALEAKMEAQRIAFAPIVFQASKSLRDLGILAELDASGENGITFSDLVAKLAIPSYGIKVLLEAGLGIGLCIVKEEKFHLTKLGYFILHDEMTRVNMDFTHDVNYLGMFDLQASIVNHKPEGLKVFGQWKTVYQALSSLPEKVQKSWFAFDHFYSDHAFPTCVKLVFKERDAAKKVQLLDIGGNTGKWAMTCARSVPFVHITIADLPGQLEMAKKNIKAANLDTAISTYETDVLDENSKLPAGMDIIWMSQFLDCFSTEEIVKILKKCKESLQQNGSLYILETYWNRQKYEAGAFSLQQTSLYFTCIANGNSQMYHSDDMKKCLQEVGFAVEEEIDHIGLGHTLLKCVKK